MNGKILFLVDFYLQVYVRLYVCVGVDFFKNICSFRRYKNLSGNRKTEEPIFYYIMRLQVSQDCKKSINQSMLSKIYSLSSCKEQEFKEYENIANIHMMKVKFRRKHQQATDAANARSVDFVQTRFSN